MHRGVCYRIQSIAVVAPDVAIIRLVLARFVTGEVSETCQSSSARLRSLLQTQEPVQPPFECVSLLLLALMSDPAGAAAAAADSSLKRPASAMADTGAAAAGGGSAAAASSSESAAKKQHVLPR